ncbi:DinB family protein [Flavobacterium branchiicola]|uniref:DinB family protein n=1 Tax=Flavobacterium branchiicola TaxID=1114875 RepID=A0ABV9PJ86_9FLAO|nr:DinB family protein [Flavobacterium branchiicola]MBS7256558.1 DinB family protein [Flavobacterium branchiicola]
MKTLIQKNSIDTFQKLNETLSLFTESDLNKIPYEGSWTAGQVVQHIILADSGFPQLFAGKTEKTTRKPDEKVKDIDALFLNFNLKMDAPVFLIPEKKEYNKNDLNLKLLKIESELLECAENYDLTLTSLDFQLPGFDHFTFYEWIDFALVHTQRHTNQLNKIFKSLNNL